MRGTPVARLAAMARARVEGCPHVEGRAPSAGELVRSLGCVPEAETDSALGDLRGEDDFVFLFPWKGVRVAGRGRVSPEGGVRVDVELSGFQGSLSSLLPRAEELGPTVLSHDGALLLGRLGSDRGLDLASSVAPEGAAQELFKLRNRLFTSAVLSGVWEIAVYPPDEDDPILPMAVALEVSNRSLAESALEELLEDLGEMWPFLRRPFSVAGASGECLEKVRVLPELDPCYVLDGNALVVGWNADSLERALSGEGSGELASSSRLLVELERFPEAERLLTRRFYGAAEGGELQVYPWRRALVSGRREGEVYHVGLELVR